MSGLLPFDLCGPLPLGATTLIEASAGSGKTYTLAALAVRFVAENDMPISQLLLATFNNAAADELRQRIRSALIDAEAYLADPQTGTQPYLETMAAVGDDERELRRCRLERSIRDFDSSNIWTIHGFCAQVLRVQGAFGAGQGELRSLTGSESDLISQVCSDILFSAALESNGDESLPDFATLHGAVSAARNLGDCQIRAESGQPVDVFLVDLVHKATNEIERRLVASSTMSFASMISTVRDLIRAGSPQFSQQLLSDLRRRFKVALIDEFQDTDAVQWEIFRTVFAEGDPRSTLIMVGDPKQAIYGFRGGDVYTYLQARTGLKPKALTTNYRSIPRVVQALNLIGDGHTFGEPEIAFQRVDIAANNQGRELVYESDLGNEEVAPGIHVRCVDDGISFDSQGSSKPAVTVEARRHRIATDVADTVVKLLHEARFRPTADGSGVNGRLSPKDIAVLVGTSDFGNVVAEALSSRSVPAIKLMGDSVVRSEAASQWMALLYAMERPSDQRRAGVAALSWFFGWKAEDLAAASATPDSGPDNPNLEKLIEVQYQLAKWSGVVSRSGFSALFTEVKRTSLIIPGLLAEADGERNLTDLEHLAELINTETAGTIGGVSPTEALAILGRWLKEDAKEVPDSMQRRVESDDDCVQIMTIHRAKGLEFPVVLLPDLASGGQRVQAKSPYSYSDRTLQRRVLDVSSKSPATDTTKSRSAAVLAPLAAAEAKRQNCGDQHRLTYVALTRASHLTVTWWADLSGNKLTGLGKLLFGRSEKPAASGSAAGHGTDYEAAVQKSDVADAISRRFCGHPGADTIQVSEVPPPLENPPTYDRNTATLELSSELTRAELGRNLERSEFRWSFSSLKATVRNAVPHVSDDGDLTAGASPDESGTGDPTIENSDDRGASDESVSGAAISEMANSDAAIPEAAITPEPDLGASWSSPTYFEGLGAGTEFGTMVHELYESADFTDPDPERVFREALLSNARFGATDEQLQRLPVALAKTLRTPLGDRFGGLTLGDLPPADRLNELDFYIPLAPTGAVSASGIGTIVGDHLDSGHPLRPWAEKLSLGLGHVELTGFMSGAIDLIFRYSDGDRTRYSVLDYKTNLLSGAGDSSVADYHPDRLASSMEHHQYLLQALIYSVALHRYLRLRVPGYSPDTHLGPIVYAFVRGMIGPESPTARSGFWQGSTAGVFTWQVPSSLVEALSDFFDGHSTGGEAK